MLVNVTTGSTRNALAFAALSAEQFCVGVAALGDRLIAICDWEGQRVAVLLHARLLENTPSLMGTLTSTHLMVPEVVDAPPRLAELFSDPMFTGCRTLVHEDEAGPTPSDR